MIFLYRFDLSRIKKRVFAFKTKTLFLLLFLVNEIWIPQTWSFVTGRANDKDYTQAECTQPEIKN